MQNKPNKKYEIKSRRYAANTYTPKNKQNIIHSESSECFLKCIHYFLL